VSSDRTRQLSTGELVEVIGQTRREAGVALCRLRARLLRLTGRVLFAALLAVVLLFVLTRLPQRARR
jgi:hypothetical protein